MASRSIGWTIVWAALFLAVPLFHTVDGFHGVVVPMTRSSAGTRTTSCLHMASTATPTKIPPKKKKKGYEPKWKKIATLADKEGPKEFSQVGLKGTIPVVFLQGDERRTTMALPGQPLREVAIQAGQFIKYGCGKGECGTCECLVNGQWIRPCSTNTPAFLEPGFEEYVVTVKQVKNKASSSGKFYSFRSFIWGFYNNVLGMVGLVKYRKAAKQNYNERMEYEQMIKAKTAEKKRLKQLQDQQQGQDLSKLRP